jgi:hypothetical protein
MDFEVDWPEPASPSVKRLQAKAYFGAESHNGRTDLTLDRDAIAPECIKFDFAGSRHGADACDVRVRRGACRQN